MSRIFRTATLKGALVICWSSGFIGAVLATETHSIYSVLFWRFVLAAILLLPFIVAYLQRPFWGALALQSLVGAFAMFGYLATGVAAIDLGVPAGTAALIGSLQPLSTAAISSLLMGEKIYKIQWIGLLFGLVGVAIAIGSELSAVPYWGFVLSIVSMMSIVAASLIAKYSKQSLPLLPTLAVHCMVSAGLFFVLAVIEGTAAPQLDSGFWMAVTWFVLFSTIGAYGCYWLCLRETSATNVASLIYLTPPVTMIWSWLMFGETISLSFIVGFGLCIFGVLLAGRTREV
ncbi:DMT family transporter [Hoeflea sp.]|uniref:DMT family transporter n=1 Tax=Hoeflea sp. TaxID=1940281 RepID=UPI00374A1C18